jgi:hypothetical protein
MKIKKTVFRIQIRIYSALLDSHPDPGTMKLTKTIPTFYPLLTTATFQKFTYGENYVHTNAYFPSLLFSQKRQFEKE